MPPPVLFLSESQLDAFYTHGMEGMRLEPVVEARPVVAPPPVYPRNLVHRCRCGRPISQNKRRCRKCWNTPIVAAPEPKQVEDAADPRLPR